MKQARTNLASVGPGIAEALIATAAGLVAAVPAVVAYNHFSNRVRLFASQMDDFAMEFLNIAEEFHLVPKVHAGGEAPSTRGRGRRVATNLAEINVVPLVDVMLVLLIIFMVTAPMIQRGVEVKLPVARRASAVEGERVFVTVPATFRTDGSVFLGDDASTRTAPGARAPEDGPPREKVYLRGDGTVQLQDLMSVFDKLKDAGVGDVGIVAKAPGDL